jgi:Tfp pilus assembly protein PilO
MKVDLGIWDRLARLIVLLLAAAAVVGVVRWYFPLIKENEVWRRRLADTEVKIQIELQESNRLRMDLEAFQDPRTVERLAREKLSYARTNELVFRFEDPATN